MLISRKQSITLSILIVVGFFAVGIFLFQAKDSIPTDISPEDKELFEATPPPEATDESVNPLLTLKTFSRSETREGKLIWRAEGDRGSYFPQENMAKIDKATLLLTREGKPFELIAGHAEIYFGDDGAISTASVSAGVDLKYNELSMLSDTAEYDHLKSIVIVPGKVKLKDRRVLVTGKKLRADLKTETFILEKDVQTILRPVKK